MMDKVTADLLQGTLDLLILKALSLGALHGYGIIQRIRQLSDEMLAVEQGSLYPALYRIEQRGWVRSKWDTNETGRRGEVLHAHARRREAAGGGGGELGPPRARDREGAAGDLIGPPPADLDLRRGNA